MTHRSLVEALTERVQRDPDKEVLVFLSPDGAVERITYARLHADVLGRAHSLKAAGLQPGELAILAFPHSYELAVAFWAALYLGAVPAIYSYLTPDMNLEVYKNRVDGLAASAEARAIVTTRDFQTYLRDSSLQADSLILSLDDSPVVGGAQEPAAIRDGEDAAYIQFSSGTTGLPKGAVLSHRKVLNHLESLSEHLRFTENDVSVGWLPLFHDMGLVGQLIMPPLRGALSVMMAPYHWIRRPQMLLQALHHYRGTIAWMPYFALNHCVKYTREQELAGIDLSPWRILCTGAELVRPEGMQRFAERFAPYGFKPETLMVGYGMAEAVLVVSTTPLGGEPEVDSVSTQALQELRQAIPVPQDAPGAKHIVGCGYPMLGTEVGIVDDDGNRLPERHAGEVVVRSNSLFTEYYRRPDLTAEVLRDGWFYTGDVGYLADGQLYIYERKKDIIIVGGHNIRPYDIETIAKAVLGASAALAVAFGIRDEELGTELPIVVCELREPLTEEERLRCVREIRQGVYAELDVTLGDVRLVERGWVMKTTSGKIARSANREQYLATRDEP